MINMRASNTNLIIPKILAISRCAIIQHATCIVIMRIAFDIGSLHTYIYTESFFGFTTRRFYISVNRLGHAMNFTVSSFPFLFVLWKVSVSMYLS